jgi:hypothetical protein
MRSDPRVTNNFSSTFFKNFSRPAAARHIPGITVVIMVAR